MDIKAKFKNRHIYKSLFSLNLFFKCHVTSWYSNHLTQWSRGATVMLSGVVVHDSYPAGPIYLQECPIYVPSTCFCTISTLSSNQYLCHNERQKLLFQAKLITLSFTLTLYLHHFQTTFHTMKCIVWFIAQSIV